MINKDNIISVTNTLGSSPLSLPFPLQSQAKEANKKIT